MQWDLGLEGLALLGAIALGFGVAAGLLVGGSWTRRARAAAIGTVRCTRDAAPVTPTPDAG